MKRIKKTNRGLTLVELIISVAIVSMVVVALMPLFVMSAKTNNASDQALQATYVGKDIM